MSVTINGVTCEVIVAGYEEHADQGGQGATRGYLCDWDDRFKVANSLLGLTTAIGTAPNVSVVHNPPGSLDDIPGIWALGVRIEGKGQPFANASGLGYEKAIVWAQYGSLPYTPGGGGEASIDPNTSFIYATQELDVEMEYVDIPGQALSFADGTPTNRDRSIIVPSVGMAITFHRVPYIPMQELAHVGKVNDALFLGCAKGTVRFDGCRVSRDFSSYDGSVLQKTAYHFTYRPRADWNKVPDPKGTGDWVLLKYKGATIYPYPYYDLRAVWPGEYVNSR